MGCLATGPEGVCPRSVRAHCPRAGHKCVFDKGAGEAFFALNG